MVELQAQARQTDRTESNTQRSFLVPGTHNTVLFCCTWPAGVAHTRALCCSWHDTRTSLQVIDYRL